MIAEIIAVGTEIILGNILNSNAQYISSRLAALGICQYHQSAVGDNPERLAEAIRLALSRADILILTGGLGPTEDDLTKEVCAETMGCELVMDEHTKARITEYFRFTGRPDITDNNWKQAMVPAGCIVLDNDNGTAPGIIIEKDGKRAVLLPGPPGELIPLFRDKVEPYLKSLEQHVLVSKMVKICGIGESRAETMILDLIDAQTNPTIATYAKTGEVHLRITARADSEAGGEALIEPVLCEVEKRFGDNIYTTCEDETLEAAVVRLLKKYSLRVSAAESMTGGMLVSRLVNVPGASECLEEGFVTYSDRAKAELLGVDSGILKEYGAVSAQTAERMAAGAAGVSGADAALSVTGFAGPGDSEDEPKGLTYISCFLNGRIVTKEYHFNGSRGKIRDSAVVKALDLLRRCILEYSASI